MADTSEDFIKSNGNETELNGISNETNYEINSNNQNLPSVKPTVVTSSSSKRPSGIPKLSSVKYSEVGSYNSSNSSRIKTPLSPGPNEMFRPNSVSKSPSPDNHKSAIEQVISPTYNKRSRTYMQSNSNDYSKTTRSAGAQSLNRYDRAMSEEHQMRQTSRDSSFSERTNTSGGGGCVIRSKIGSLQNANYKPGGGNVQIYERKLDFSNVTAKCGSTKNIKHKPGGGNVQIREQKIDLSNVQSKCGSKQNIKHKPTGGDVKIFEQKVNFKESANSKVQSLANVTHKPTGGDVKIESRKLEWKTESKVGSLNNVKHKPTGGNVKIINEPLPWLKFNKPNLPPEEVARINKRTPTGSVIEGMVSPNTRSYSNSICSERSN